MAEPQVQGSRGRVGLCVNPMSGRDVRRLAAHAANMTHETKRDIVARVAAGADAMGATDLYVAAEPFQIAARALKHLDLDARVHELAYPLRNDATDTERALDGYLDAGCRTLVSLGGDGTNRAIVRRLIERGIDADLIPLSTGTNNVFPVLAEPTVAGMVAGMSSLGVLDGAREKISRRAKVLHVTLPQGVTDIGLIDAVLLANDHVGNLLPFRADCLRRIVLSRAEPDAVGMSPVGGLLDVVDAAADEGLLVEMGPGVVFRAPLSPGLFSEVSVAGNRRLPFEVPVILTGPGVLALDGDRDHRLRDGQRATVTLRRDGPWVVDLKAAMRHAVRHGMIARL